MSSFFTLPASQRKRKRTDGPSTAPRKRSVSGKATHTPTDLKKKKKNNPAADDESIASDISSRSGSPAPLQASDSDSDDGETDADRRLKLAEQYLENIRAEISAGREGEEEIGFDAAEIDRELIAARLKEDTAEDKGKVHRFIARDLDWENATCSRAKANTLAMTGVALSADGKYLFGCSKDMRVLKWETNLSTKTMSAKQQNDLSQKLETKLNGVNGKHGKSKKPRRRNPKQLLCTHGDKNKAQDSAYQHHTAPILCVATSQDGKFLVTGGADRKVIVWDPNTLAPLKIFPQHRDSVTGLAFRGRTNQLFSGSKDRTVKIWSLNELAYIETLFGHQDEVVDIAAVGGSQERCVSVGARDRSARVWKVIEESQLVFRGGGASSGSFKRDKNQQKKRLTVGEAAVAAGRMPQYLKDLALNNDGSPNIDGLTPAPPLPPPTFHEGSLDRVTQLDTQLFVTGSDSGTLSLFSLHKKKPQHVYPLAHGWDAAPSDAFSLADVTVDKVQSPVPRISNPVPNHSPHANAANAPPTPRYITALTCLPYSDVFVSGSWDGYIRVWRVAGGPEGSTSVSDKHIEAVAVLGLDEGHDQHQTNGNSAASDDHGYMRPRRINGIVNDLAIAPLGERGKEGVVIAAAMGKEGRLGRWMGGFGPGGVRVTQDGDDKDKKAQNGKGRNEVLVWVVQFKTR